MVFLALGGGAEEVRDLHGVGRDGDDLVLAKLDGAARVIDETGNVRAKEVLAFSQPHDEGRVAAGGHDDVRPLGVHGEERERAFEPLAGKLHRFGEPSVGRVPVELVTENVAQKCCGNFGVRLRLEGDALGDEFLLEFGEVFNDSVVDHGQASAIGQMRVGVLVGGSAVGGPPCVADAGQRVRERISVELVQQIAQLSGLLAG